MKNERLTFSIAAFAILWGLVISVFDLGSDSSNDPAPAATITAEAN